MNTEPNNPFIPAQPFQPATSSTPPAADRPKRRASGKKAAKPTKAKKPRKVTKSPLLAAPYGETQLSVANPPPPKKARKPRVAKKADKALVKRTLDINSIVSATVGLKAEEAKMLLSIVGKLNDFNKAGKLKVVGALGKLFG